jgi:hypothetical protein
MYDDEKGIHVKGEEGGVQEIDMGYRNEFIHGSKLYQ